MPNWRGRYYKASTLHKELKQIKNVMYMNTVTINEERDY